MYFCFVRQMRIIVLVGCEFWNVPPKISSAVLETGL
jgi:hypothetical protein